VTAIVSGAQFSTAAAMPAHNGARPAASRQSTAIRSPFRRTGLRGVKIHDLERAAARRQSAQ